jgi:hypothetical protein
LSARASFRKLVDYCLRTEGSTRSCALIRMLLVAVIWARWAEELMLYKQMGEKGPLLCVSFFLSTTLMFFGVATRVTTLWTAVVLLCMYYYFGFALGREPWTHHHTYLLSFATLLCALTPCDRSYSVDRWLALRRAERAGEPPPPERGNLWALRLIAIQLSVIYFYAALSKTTLGFLSGARMEHYFLFYLFGEKLPNSRLFHLVMQLTAWATVLLEYALVFMPLAKVRRYLAIPGLLFHGVLYVLLPVETYTATMAVLYLAYFDPDAVHAVIDRLQGVAPSATPLSGAQP